MNGFGEMQSLATNMFSAYASVAASMMLFRSLANDIIPEPVKSFFLHIFKTIFGKFWSQISTQMTIVVDEQSGLTRNHIYDAAEIYLRTKINPNAERLKANKSHKQKVIILSMEKGEQVIDTYKNIRLKWQFVLVEPDKDKGGYDPEKKYFELSFEKPCRDAVVNEYLPYVLKRAKEIKDNDKAVKLYTRDYYDNDDDEGNGGGTWGSINMDHPVTFDKLAMDPSLKKSIIEDLDRFLRRRDYYKKVGKAWKRGYLLYGPPGTGKSSLIAAMANYLKFDVYDLELTSLYSNSELRRILLCTTNRSIIVIEDIDCSAQMHDRDTESEPEDTSNTKLTLSGLLNFIDGLWSTCGDERIIIFTTNHKEKLDPALLRPGRMDMHIHMGYCTVEGFDVLGYNYLGIRDHPRLYPPIKDLIKEVEVTPAEIAEHLMRNEDVDLALAGVLDLLRQKKDEQGDCAVSEGGSVVEKDIEGVEIEEKEKRVFGAFVRSLRKLSKRSSRGSHSRRRNCM